MSTDTIRERWDGLGPWERRSDTPWGSCVVHADFGEAYIGTNLRVTPPTDKWKAEAAESARDRRRVMCEVACAIAAAPADVAALLAEVDRLGSRLEAVKALHARNPESTHGYCFCHELWPCPTYKAASGD